MRLAAGLCPDPLGELNRSPDPLAAIRGPTSKGRVTEGMVREEIVREGRGRGNLLQGVRGHRRPWYRALLTWL